MSETPSHREAAEKRTAAAKASTDVARGYIDALLVERRGYVVREMAERVAAVDAELERAGYVAPKAERPAREGRRAASA